ncbi:MAG: peptide deformylase [Cyclobacteriaceae bacterium]|nr:peptide deformylase [Cyclobacteriaceae bacterium]
MVYPIVVFGDPVLRKRGQSIPLNSDIAALVSDMFETMYAADGVGLAAPQIGKSIRLFVIDGSGLEVEGEDMTGFRKAFVNAEMLEEFDEFASIEEGCLSIPHIRDNVKRRSHLRIRYYDEQWQLHEESFTGMKARIIQHEYDHIEGKLFIDYLTPLKKKLLKGKLSNISKGEVRTEYRILAPLKK